ncbi:DUF4349 domain-containing protein [Hymenobacter glaciei]|uniref:DUF4349 domain-containing protein n=1 Tax=Hymenobacter glaciei TaxID=877209 RepID=A0ABP7T8P5_9BACT
MKNAGVFALMLVSFLTGCSERKQESTMQRETIAEPAPVSMAPSPPSSPNTDEVEDAAAPGAAAPLPIPTGVVAPARLLIYHAELRLKVPSLPQASASLDSIVRRNEGFLSAATETRADGEWQQLMTIRVRPARFHTLLAALSGLGTVEEKKLTTDDVTAQHADVAARLATKRAVEKRYVDLLGRARKISEILEIEGKIGEVREEIESTESRLKTLDDEVGYSTISLACYQVLPQSVPDAPVVSFASRVVESFYTGWTLLTGLFIGLVAIWPLWLMAPVAWWMLRRWRKRPLAA